MRTNPILDTAHAMALLRKLNFQRMDGQFCDLVIRQHLNPGKLYMAHKSVLAASSPVLASLLPRKSALLDLQFPSSTTEILGTLLEFIYTGTLPPTDEGDSLLSAATYLQMEELKQALRDSRMHSLSVPDCTVAADIKSSLKRNISDLQQSTKKENCPSYNLPQPLRCEVVPVICHVSTGRNPSLASETQVLSKNLNIGSDVSRNMTDDRLGRSAHGENLKHYGLDRYGSEDDTLQVSHPKQIRILSESPTVQEPPITAPEEEMCHSGRLHCEFDEKAVLKTPGNAFLADNVVCSTFQAEEDAATTIQECNCPNPDTTSKDREGFPKVNQLERNKNKTSKCHFTRQLKSISDDDEYIPENAKETPPVGKFYNFWSSKFTSGYCPQGDVTKGSQSDSRLNLQTEVASYCTINPKSLTFNEGRSEIKVSNTNANKIQRYQGQIRYHYLAQEKPHLVQSSDTDEDVLDSTMARHGQQGDLRTDVEDSGLDFVLLDISTKHPMAGNPDSNVSQLSLAVPASIQQYQCTMCETAFSQRGSLNRHMRSHLGVRPYSCPQCSMTFSRQYRVTEHLRVHQRDYTDL